jgi:hypothetical protein
MKSGSGTSSMWQIPRKPIGGKLMLMGPNKLVNLGSLDVEVGVLLEEAKKRGWDSKISSTLASVERTAGGPAKDLSYAAISLENLSERISSDVLSKVYESLGDVKDLRSEGALDHLDLSDYDRLVSRVTKESAAIGLSIALLSKATDRLSEGY